MGHRKTSSFFPGLLAVGALAWSIHPLVLAGLLSWDLKRFSVTEKSRITDVRPMDSAGTALSLPQAAIRKVRVEILGLEDYWKLHLPRPAILKPGASESSPEGFNTPNCWVNDSRWGQKQQCSVSSGDGILYNCAQIVF